MLNRRSILAGIITAPAIVQAEPQMSSASPAPTAQPDLHQSIATQLQGMNIPVRWIRMSKAEPSSTRDD